MREETMKNVGTFERLVRLVLGVVVLMFVTRTNWAWLGLVPLITGIVGYCPLYQVFGWSTAPKPKTM
jgi:hypothetical protein